jgi:hypothetical protein
MKNLYGQKGYDKITEQLKKQLNQLIEQYNDTEAKEILAGEKDGTGIKK